MKQTLRTEPNPTGRVDIFLTRCAALVLRRFEAEMGVQGVSSLAMPHIEDWTKKKFGPRRRR